MSKTPPQPKAEPEAGGKARRLFVRSLPTALALLRRMAQALACGLGRMARACMGRRAAVHLLLALIALELVVLGIGVTRKLGDAYRWETDLARTHLAVVEAQLLSKGLTDSALTEGSAGIGAAAADAPIELPAQSSDEAPPLRPRDIQTIIEQETGGWNAEDDPVLSAAAQQQTAAHGEDAAAQPAPTEGAQTTAESAAPAAEGEEPTPEATAGADSQAPVIPAPRALNEEETAELDRLIRKGVAAMTAGDMRLCILSFEQARTIEPNHPALLYYYGLAYDKLLNPNRARELYMRVFRMRDRAGSYFERASRRLTYGLEQPSAMRGKLSFGPHQVRHRYDENEGESVSILLPVLLAPGEEVRPDDLYVTFQAFDIVNGRKIEFARLAKPQMSWERGTPTWADWEENLRIDYAVPPLTQEELEAYGDLKYYGFTAKLYYKGEPLDCISSPSALILQEQRLLSRRSTPSRNHLLPDDGLESEEALPITDFLHQLETPQP